MSLHFFQYSCGFAGFLEQKPKNRFTVDVQAAVRETIRCSGGFRLILQAGNPAFLRFAAFSPLTNT